jgi:nucleoside-diphosphate-sugar epimerase
VRVLVMGGNRYIGLSLVRALARRGHEVTVANSHEVELPAGVARIHVDRRIPGALDDALAARAGDFDAVFDNTAYDIPDLEPLVEIFDGRLQHFVFTSSVAVYRRSFVQPVREDFRVHEAVGDQPLRSYAVGKVRAERYLGARFERTGFPATTVRVTHTIGPRSPLASRDPGFFARLEAGRPILIPGDGFPFIHLVHIDDVADLLASVLGNDRAVGQTYNAAGAEYASILGTVHLMARAAGVEPDIVNVPIDYLLRTSRSVVHWNEGTAGGTVFSIDKALAELDWSPRFGLPAACADSYAWFAAGGRGTYQFDFSDDDAILADLAAAGQGVTSR